MDFDLRQWLMVLGPVIIIGVLLHGYLRMRASQNQIKMDLDKSFTSQMSGGAEVDELSLLKAELPNGGARIVSRHEQLEEIPMMVDPVDLSMLSVTDLSDLSEDEPEWLVPQNKLNDLGRGLEKKLGDGDEEEVNTGALGDGEGSWAKAQHSFSEVPEMFVVINVLAIGEPFSGQPLLELLLEGDMAFGEMDIFHRRVKDEVWFSLANAVEPGTFDIATMNRCTTPGVTMFMRVHELREPDRTLEEMLFVANALATELNGDVRDETRSVMTPQTIEHYRQSIKEFQFRYSA